MAVVGCAVACVDCDSTQAILFGSFTVTTTEAQTATAIGTAAKYLLTASIKEKDIKKIDNVNKWITLFVSFKFAHTAFRE
jgi:hypothetical protein